MMQEEEFFSSENVSVSRTRFVAFGQTYAMSGVTSVRVGEIKPSMGFPIIFGFLGCFFCIMGIKSSMLMLVLGVVLFVLAGLIINAQKTEYTVQLHIASGEIPALKSPSKEYIDQVVQALNDCIVARG
jgi:hypothetical protein